jgi:hypothetical protein
MMKLALLLAAALVMAGAAHADQLARFGIRNQGCSETIEPLPDDMKADAPPGITSRRVLGECKYGPAGWDRDTMANPPELMKDGTVLVDLLRPFSTAGLTVRLEGDRSISFAIIAVPNSHELVFKRPVLNPQDVAVLIIEGNPPPTIPGKAK